MRGRFRRCISLRTITLATLLLLAALAGAFFLFVHPPGAALPHTASIGAPAPATHPAPGSLLDSVLVAHDGAERYYPAPGQRGIYGRAVWFEEYADTALTAVFGPKIFFPLVVVPRFFNQAPDTAAVQKAVDEELPPANALAMSRALLRRRSPSPGSALQLPLGPSARKVHLGNLLEELPIYFLDLVSSRTTCG